MSRPSILAYVYDVGLCAIALGVLFSSPLSIGAKIGLAAAFLAIVNGITDVGLTLVRANLAQRRREAAKTSPELDLSNTGEQTYWKRYATLDTAGLIVHNIIVVAGGVVVALVLHLA